MSSIAKPKAHVADYKKKIVDSLAKDILDYPIIGAINMENLPAPQLQSMMISLRGKLKMVMTKRRLMKIAIEKAKAKKDISSMIPHLKGMPALIFTKENPFSLFKTLKKNKTKAPAKAGQTAPRDCIVPAGPTPFAPGPVISELASVGIKTGVENGKVAVKFDTVVVKEGQVITPKQAEILTKFNIKPMEIGLNLVAVYENGDILTKDVLDIDEDKFMATLKNCARWAFNLSVEAGYTNKDNIKFLVGKAFRDSRSLALAQEIFADEVVEMIVGKAEREALAVKAAGNISTEPYQKKT